MNPEGYLLIDKPKDWTSFDVVAKTRNILKSSAQRKVKVGHTGTLDPIATGLLILVVGSYTKKSEHFLKLDKSYVVDIDLSKTSDTLDTEGAIIELTDLKKVDKAKVEQFLKGLTGTVEQVPPKFSAIKVGGKRSYKLAREGKAVKLEPREVELISAKITDYSWPNLTIELEVGSGFYVRSLVRDLGANFNIGGVMTDLRRETVGEYSVNNAVKVDELNPDNINSFIKRLD